MFGVPVETGPGLVSTHNHRAHCQDRGSPKDAQEFLKGSAVRLGLGPGPLRLSWVKEAFNQGSASMYRLCLMGTSSWSR